MKRLQADRDYVSVREAARILEVHENTIRNMVDDGRLDHIRLPGSKFRRVSVKSLEAIMNGQAEHEHADLFANQDDILVALTTKPPRFGPSERASMRKLPPWRAVMMARLAVSCGVMESDELDALIEEARAVGGSGRLLPLGDA